MTENGQITAIATTVSDVRAMATAIVQSKLFNMQTVDQAMALMLLCQADKIHPMKAVQRYHIIQGRPSMKSDALLADFVARGGKVEWHERTDDKASATFTSTGCPKGLKVEWDMDRAEQAKLTGKDNWKNYPRQMLSARVVAEGVRAVDPGALQGLYTSEEVQDFPIAESKPAEKDITAEVQATPAAVQIDNKPALKTTESAPEKPARKSKAKTETHYEPIATDLPTITIEVPELRIKDGISKKTQKPYKTGSFKHDGKWFSTFDTNMMDVLENLKGSMATISYTENEYGCSIKEVIPAGDEQNTEVPAKGDTDESALPF